MLCSSCLDLLSRFLPFGNFKGNCVDRKIQSLEERREKIEHVISNNADFGTVLMYKMNILNRCGVKE